MAGILIDEAALEEIRKQPCCLCGVIGNNHGRGQGFMETGRLIHAHHVIKRGMGGGSRFDHRHNLLSVCWLCHERLDNMPTWLQFYLIAVREYLTGDVHSSEAHTAQWYQDWVIERTRDRNRKAMEES